MNLDSAINFDPYECPEAEALLISARERHARTGAGHRLLVTEATAATVFSAAALALAALGSSPQTLTLPALAVSVGCYLAATCVRFPVGSAFTMPTAVVFVPMLFVLPTQLVPLILAVCALGYSLPSALKGGVALTRTLANVADCSYSLGPALVLILASEHSLQWDRWSVLLAAFTAQVVLDAGAGLSRSWSAERTPPAQQLPMLWVFLTDACLWCVGLAIAAAAAGRPGLIALSLPLIGLLWLLARERQGRLDFALALSAAYKGTALLLGDVVEADDHYTGMHSHDVVQFSLATASELGLDASRRRSVEFAALLHDIGKIRVPKEIINKPGALESDELTIIRQHTIEGERMLTQVGGTLARVGRFVRASHEHFDGRGYPDGIAGEQIPLESRIVAVCDAFSAMTTSRPYRRTMVTEQALAELRRCAGSQFDPQVVGAFERCLLRAPGRDPGCPGSASQRSPAVI
jgi:putative nucleotidyltransferase with HDIG domain